MRHFLPLLILFLLVLGNAGCGSSFDRLEISAIIPSVLGGHLNEVDTSVPEGLALKATIVAFDDDGKALSLDIRANDPTILDVEPVVADHAYAFIGRKVGHTDLVFTADGHVVLTVAADVVAQPSPP